MPTPVDSLRDAPGGGGVELPCRDVKVSKRELAQKAVVGGFISLVEGNHIRLSIVKRRALLGLRKRQVVQVEAVGGGLSDGSLEAGLLASLDQDAEKNAVTKVVERLLPISGDPWADVIERIEEDLLGQGYFTETEREKKMARFFLGKKLVPQCERFAALEERVPAVEEMLDGFRSANGEVYDQLVKDVRRAIRARQEVDMDFD